MTFFVYFCVLLGIVVFNTYIHILGIILYLFIYFGYHTSKFYKTSYKAVYLDFDLITLLNQIIKLVFIYRKWRFNIFIFMLIWSTVITIISHILPTHFAINFLQHYADLLMLDESFMCSDRTPGLDLEFVLFNPEGADWGPGISKGERRPTPPSNNNIPEGENQSGPNNSNNNPNNNPNGPEGPTPQGEGNQNNPREQTWKEFIERQQQIVWYNDNTMYRVVHVRRANVQESLRRARLADESVLRGERPKMSFLRHQDRFNLTSAYWRKFKNKPASYCPDNIPFNRHEFMMRGKDYNSTIREILRILERRN